MCYNFKVNNRDYKNFSKNNIYHIYNRGVDKMNIFKKEKDFKVFIFRLRENIIPSSIDPKIYSKSARRRKALPKNSFDLICYCLMPNHFHLLIQQKTDLPITKLMSKICTGYAKYFNKEYKRIGAVFQDQFKTVRIENNEQLIWTSFYIHKNPLEACLVKNIKDYKWSSFNEYFDSSQKNDLCNKIIICEQFNNPNTYLNYFQNKEKSVATSLQNYYYDFNED